MEKLSLAERLKTISMKTSQDYIAEIVGPVLHDGCNLSDDENDEHECGNNSLKTSNSGIYKKTETQNERKRRYKLYSLY